MNYAINQLLMSDGNSYHLTQINIENVFTHTLSILQMLARRFARMRAQ